MLLSMDRGIGQGERTQHRELDLQALHQPFPVATDRRHSAVKKVEVVARACGDTVPSVLQQFILPVCDLLTIVWSGYSR